MPVIAGWIPFLGPCFSGVYIPASTLLVSAATCQIAAEKAVTPSKQRLPYFFTDKSVLKVVSALESQRVRKPWTTRHISIYCLSFRSSDTQFQAVSAYRLSSDTCPTAARLAPSTHANHVLMPACLCSWLAESVIRSGHSKRAALRFRSL